MICPNCGSEAIHRSKRRGASERVWFSLLGVFPYRCSACQTRFRRYHPDLRRDLRRVVATAPAWLKSLVWGILVVLVGLVTCVLILLRIAKK